jgi:predicted site-specific integrase-resolvase
MFVTLSKAVEKTGLSGNTLRKYADNGKIPYYRLPNGDRRFDVSAFCGGKRSIVCYARVSTTKQKPDLERQVEWLLQRHPGAETVRDIGSGLSFKRKGIKALLERALSGEQLTIVVSYRDRLARFGFDLIEWIVSRSGGEIVVLNKIDSSPQSELVSDLMAIVTVFSARLHGLRNYRKKIKSDITETE